MLRMINVEVQRHGNENVGGLMRRFSRKMQSSGVVRKVRGMRYFERALSKTKQKKEALTRITRTDKFLELQKEGRIMPAKKKFR